MPFSQNGYSADPNPDVIGIQTFVVDGVSFGGGVRAGAAHKVLMYVAQQLHERVEPAQAGLGCYGWNYRANVNDPTVLSNHASGTAIDYNAGAHPNGVPTTSTWTSDQINQINQILFEVSHAVRWGGDYTYTPDAMHFEIDVDEAALELIAAGLDGPVSWAEPVETTLSTFNADIVDDTYNGATDHLLVGWDETHVAAIYAHYDGFQMTVQMLTIEEDNSLTPGPRALFPGDPNGQAHSACRVGDVLVVLLRHTQELFTFTYDAETGVFVLVASPVVEMGDATPGDGGRVLPWGPTTGSTAQILIYRAYMNGSPLQGRLQFGYWDGIEWYFGPVSTHTVQFGSPDYTYFARIGPDSAPMAIGQQGHWTAASYCVIGGSYPSAPSIGNGGSLAGLTSFFVFEFFTTPNRERVLRALPLEPGTTKPLAVAASLFDWGIMPLTVLDGQVMEGEIVNLGPTNESFDISLTETAEGSVWGTYTTGSQEAPSLVVHRPGEEQILLATEDPADGGFYPGDYFVRSIASAGNHVIASWMTNSNWQFRVGLLAAGDPVAGAVVAQFSYTSNPQGIVLFDGSLSTSELEDDPIVTWQWDFGDLLEDAEVFDQEQPDEGVVVEHNFAVTDMVYLVTLTVGTAMGVEASVTYPVYVPAPMISGRLRGVRQNMS